MQKIVILLGIILIAAGGCDSGKVAQLQQDLDRVSKELVQLKEELNKTKSDLDQASQKLASINEETAKTAKEYQEKDKIAQEQIKALQAKAEQHIEDLGRDGVVVPTYLVGKSVTIYGRPTRGPLDDVQVYIGVVKEVKHKEKVILSETQDKTIEVPYNEITGYRLNR